MSRHAWMTAVFSLVISFVLFGAGVATILTLPVPSAEAQLLLPVVVLVSLLVVPFVAERLALKMTSGESAHDRDDRISSGRTYPRGG